MEAPALVLPVMVGQHFSTRQTAYVRANAGNDTISVSGTSTDSTLRGGKGNDFISQTGAISGSKVLSDYGSDAIVVSEAVSGGTSVYGGSLAATSTDADSLTFKSLSLTPSFS